MKYSPLVIALMVASALSGCSGNSNSSKSNVPAGSICPELGFNLLLAKDVPIDFFSSDKNNDQCISPTEMVEVNETADLLLSRSIAVTGTNQEDQLASITNFRAIGSSEPVEGKVQLHTNNPSGFFAFVVKVDNRNNDGEYLRLQLSDQKFGQGGAVNKTFSYSIIPKEQLTLTLSCKYRNPLAFICDNWALFEGNKETAMRITDIKSSEPGENFADNNVPKSGYALISVCKNDVCGKNYAEVPVSFN